MLQIPVEPTTALLRARKVTGPSTKSSVDFINHSRLSIALDPTLQAVFYVYREKIIDTEICKIEEKGGRDFYALDMAGAQFGYYEPMSRLFHGPITPIPMLSVSIMRRISEE
jgi:hypothetical protein